MKRIIAGLVLSSLLHAAEPSVEVLLRSPGRRDYVQLQVTGGRSVTGMVARVTNEFVAVRGQNTCEMVDVADIVKVRRMREPNDEGPLWPLVVLFAVTSPAWIPIVAAEGVMYPFIRHSKQSVPFTGRWESADGTMFTIEPHTAERSGYVVELGTYGIERTMLRLDSGKTYEVEFNCDKLKLGDGWAYAARWPGPVDAPIVGIWSARSAEDWTFLPDRTYQVRRLASELNGAASRSGRAVRIEWSDGRSSLATRKGNGVLLTTQGVAEEFRPTRN